VGAETGEGDSPRESAGGGVRVGVEVGVKVGVDTGVKVGRGDS